MADIDPPQPIAAELDPAETGVRAQKKDALRNRMIDELIALVAEGRLDVSHDLIAERAGVGRRTVYRYFPDRDSLLQGAWDRVTSLAGPNVNFPKSEADLLGTLRDIYTGFDSIAPLATLVRSTPQGRAVRASQNKRRIESYTAATAEAVKDLPPEDQKLATAMLQVLHTTPWLEMRDHWGLDGEQIARATGWAIRTLLADLKVRGGRGLGE
jgi:AcrR family transcriptional regulator